MRQYRLNLLVHEALDSDKPARTLHKELLEMDRADGGDGKIKLDDVVKAMESLRERAADAAGKPLMEFHRDTLRRRLTFLADFCDAIDACIIAFPKENAPTDIDNYEELWEELQEMLTAQTRLETTSNPTEIPALIDTLLETRGLDRSKFVEDAIELWPGHTFATSKAQQE